MTDYTVEIQPDLIRKLGRTEPVRAASELIWNGLDADATEVSIDLEYDDLGGMSKIVVTDNGDGIPYADAPILFGKLGGSWKRRGDKTKRGRQLHGYEGRGRYKAFSLGRVVDWYVTYEKEDGVRFSYVISILEADTNKWTPLIGQRGSEFKVESDIVIMLPVRAVRCPHKSHSVSDHSDWSEAARDYNTRSRN